MNKNLVGVLIYATFLICGVVLLVNFCSATRDVSWIADVENSVVKENWVPDKEYIGLMDTAFFLYENETEQYFFLESQKEFISVINGIMNRVDRQVKKSISWEFVERMLSSDRILKVAHRFSTKSSLWTPPNDFGSRIDYDNLYFVLEDNSGTGLEGTIIVREHSFGGSDSNYSVWQVSNGIFW